MTPNLISKLSRALRSDTPAEGLVLESVDARARIRSNLAETTVEQIYRNQENSNIEAVYTFALPSDAVLLDVTLELNGRTLEGLVRERPRAEHVYENAVEDGDSAVLLTQLSAGLYAMNVANLMPGETARVRYRYAQIMRWQSDTLRYFLPTTIPPRYGVAARAGMMPHEVPQQALNSGRNASITVSIEGALASADVSSPSHKVAISAEGDTKMVRLRGGETAMDRDYVIVITRHDEAVNEVLWSDDGEHTAALAIFNPRVGAGRALPARCIKLVVDCSGSMAGDSIDQARKALAEVLSLMRSGDRFNVLRFGSHYEQLFPHPVSVTRENLNTARHCIDALDADLGGTEIRRALHAAFNDGPTGGSADVLLITDGNVYEDSGLLDAARRSQHRLFAVGVGSAVSEDMVRGLAAATGGACELVSPNESMAEAIVRQFRRITQPRVESTTLEWPGEVLMQAPSSPSGIYCGDTLPAFAWLDAPPSDDVSVTYRLEDGYAFTERASADAVALAGDTVARLAAAERLRELDEQAAAELAVRYRLITPFTSCVLVYERDAAEKATTLPELRSVEHTLSAGWGGYGSVDACMSEHVVEACMPSLSLEGDERMMRRSSEPGHLFLRPAPGHRGGPSRSTGKRLRSFVPAMDVAPLVANINAADAHTPAGAPFPIASLADLFALGLPRSLAVELMALKRADDDDGFIIYFVLLRLRKHPDGRDLKAGIVRRARLQIVAAAPYAEELRREVELAVEHHLRGDD